MRSVKTIQFRMVIAFFGIMILSGVCTAAVIAVLGWYDWVPRYLDMPFGKTVSVLSVSLIFGFFFSVFVIHWFMRPLQEVISAMKQVSAGNFDIRVKESVKQTEIGELQRSFNHMAQELGSIEMFRNDFINNFSHEFKTPIVSIRGFARQLQFGDLTEQEKQEYLNIIIRESDRLSKMSTGVLALSKLENQRIVTNKVEFSLDEQLRHAVLLLEKAWSDKEIEIFLDLEETQYCFDEEMLMQVWLNLLNNAIKFTPPGGTVSLSLSACEDGCRVSVQDTGIGMSEAVCNRIFEKFYQGDPSRSEEGNGIGLTVVRCILKLCGGSVEVQSEVGKGSTFRVFLPK